MHGTVKSRDCCNRQVENVVVGKCSRKSQVHLLHSCGAVGSHVGTTLCLCTVCSLRCFLCSASCKRGGVLIVVTIIAGKSNCGLQIWGCYEQNCGLQGWGCFEQVIRTVARARMGLL